MEPKPEPTDDQIRQSFEVCRSEIQHEYGMLANRLNSYMTSQAFLVSAYAISMGNMHPAPNGDQIRLGFPLLLCTVGFLLSVRAHPGINEVCNIIDRWHAREADLFNLKRGLEDYAVLHHADVKTLHSRTLVFAQASPWIFGVAWVLMAAMAILFHTAPTY